jgi:thiol:disulfide interchange protein
MKLSMVLLLAPILLVAQEPKPAVPYQAVAEYDAKRNADQDLKDAIAEATKTHKRILIEVGGQWCSWCKIMDDFYVAHPPLENLRNANFVLLKVYFGPGNNNRDLLSKFPPVNSFPYIFILDEDGKLLKAKRTGELEAGRSYDLKKFTAFLNEWASVKKCPDLKDCGS